MPCTSPIRGYRAPGGQIKFSRAGAWVDRPMTVRCGQCIDCKLKRTYDWALRCMHEASLYEQNCMITLTYNDESLPKDMGLELYAHQRFFKRFRKKFSEKKIRFFMCGEYGEKYLRPHYHYIIFGHDFDDKYHYDTRNGVKYYRSPTLEKLWPSGFSSIGNVTFQSAAYVARYCMKKITGPMAEDAYWRCDEDTGEVWQVRPEFNAMSKGSRKGTGGIGKRWYDLYKKDLYPSDNIHVDGRQVAVPRYYDRLLEQDDIELFTEVKNRRVIRAKALSANYNDERLAARNEVLKSRLNLLPRNLE